VAPAPNRGKNLTEGRVRTWQFSIGPNAPPWKAIAGKVGGAWVFKDTRMPVSTVFENLESGSSIEEIMEWFDVTREQIAPVLEFAARSLDAAPPTAQSLPPVDVHPL
jgi:uncharacterized protein (DUF433 family)